MTNWSKRRRLEAVISGEKPDRLPVALWRHWPGDDQDAAALAAAHLKWQRDYDWDLLKSGPGQQLFSSRLGRGRSLGRAHRGHARNDALAGAVRSQDWASLQILDPRKGKLAMQI